MSSVVSVFFAFPLSSVHHPSFSQTQFSMYYRTNYTIIHTKLQRLFLVQLTYKRTCTCVQFMLLNDFTCRETWLHNADRFNRLITLGSIQRYAV